MWRDKAGKQVVAYGSHLANSRLTDLLKGLHLRNWIQEESHIETEQNILGQIIP